MIKTKSVQTRANTIARLDKDIIRVARRKGIEMTLQDLQEISVVYNQILINQQGKFLIIVDDECDSEVGFIKKMAEVERSKVKKAGALIVNSLGKRLEANFYIRRYKPSHAVKVFSSEREGLDWLMAI
tara:strand:- start:1 stop:384 length:384 start_codon:yes stop_codon:yes gene_type:complete